MRYALPDVGSLEWYATPLNAAVADLDKRIHAVEATDPVPGTSGEKWFSGAGAPATGIREIGDWYLDTVSGDVHEKTGASTWTLRGNVRGPAGATGPPGAAADRPRNYRQPTKPWPDGDLTHADDVGDLWFQNPGVSIPVTNPGFETGTNGWQSLGGGIFTRDTTQAHSGSASGKVYAWGYGGIYSNATNVSGASVGTIYTVSVWLKGNAGGEVIRIDLLQNGGTYLVFDQRVTLTTQWQRYTVTATWPLQGPLTSSEFLQLWIQPITYDATWWTDDVRIDGPGGHNTPNIWTGSAWVAISDTAIADAQVTADAALIAAQGARSYHHVQGTVSSTWSIPHNLGFYPAVTVRDSAGSICEGDITYADVNHLTVSFSAPFSGVADLS